MLDRSMTWNCPVWAVVLGLVLTMSVPAQSHVRERRREQLGRGGR